MRQHRLNEEVKLTGYQWFKYKLMLRLDLYTRQKKSNWYVWTRNNLTIRAIGVYIAKKGRKFKNIKLERFGNKLCYGDWNTRKTRKYKEKVLKEWEDSNATRN